MVCEGSANASVAEEAKVACAAMGCYAFKLGGTIANGSTQDSIAPNLIGAPLHFPDFSLRWYEEIP